MSIFEKVKENISMSQLIQHFNIQINRQGFIMCPFHSEKTPSLKIYGNSFYCFGCGASGTIIDFTKDYMSMDLLEATKYLSKEFGINTSEKLSFREQYMYEKAKRQSNKNKVFDDWVRKTSNTILDYYRILYQNSLLFNLENELYVEAMHNLVVLDYYLDWLQEDPLEFYKLNRKWVEKVARRVDILTKQK